MSESSAETPKVISFKEAGKNLKDIPLGTTITGVKPQELWTTQEWVDTQKVQNALNRTEKDDCPAVGYICSRNGKGVLVLGDGNTKSIIAFIRGETINFRVDSNLSENAKIIPLRVLKNRYADLFQEFEYK